MIHASVIILRRFNENITSSFRMYYESQGPYSKDRKIISKTRVQVRPLCFDQISIEGTVNISC